MKRRELGKRPVTDTAPEPEKEKRVETAQDDTPRVSHTFASPMLCAAVFLLLLISRAVDFSGVVTDRSGLYLSLIALQLFVYMLPALLYIRLRRIDVRRDMRMKFFSPDKFLTVLSAALFLVFLQIFAASLGLMPVVPEIAGVSAELSSFSDTRELLLSGICFALLPALCEELLFRGVILSEYRKSGTAAAVFVSSLFFGMLHFDLHRLFFCVIAGIVFAICTYATGSVLAAITAHLLYNLVQLYGSGIAQSVLSTLGERTLILFFFGVLALLCAALFLGECQRLYSGYASQGEKEGFYPVRRGESFVRFFLALFSPASLLCMVIFTAAVLLL